jgi:hypothetical protein
MVLLPFLSKDRSFDLLFSFFFLSFSLFPWILSQKGVCCQHGPVKATLNLRKVPSFLAGGARKS